LREGTRIILERDVASVLPHERNLLAAFHGALKNPGRYRWYGADTVIAERAGEGRLGLVGLNVDGFAPAEFAAILDERFDIAVRAGLHCAPYAHKHLGTFPQGMVRLSVGIQTTPEEMKQAAAAFDEIILD
jgi:cysteine desulfurase/selenocysteine lyase